MLYSRTIKDGFTLYDYLCKTKHLAVYTCTMLSKLYELSYWFNNRLRDVFPEALISLKKGWKIWRETHWCLLFPSFLWAQTIYSLCGYSMVDEGLQKAT